MSEDGDVRAVVDQARGVLAERFGVTTATADGILPGVARVQRADAAEVAEAVVESCISQFTPLPQSLYNNDTEAA
jgi:hypothetical protein